MPPAPKQAVLVGAETFIGSHLAKALAADGYAVTALAADAPSPDGAASCLTTDYLHYDLPSDCPLVLFCHDVSRDRDLHVRALSALCEHLAAVHRPDQQVHLVYFSSTNICNANGRRIREDSEIHPHCLRDAAVAQAETLLKTWSALSGNAIAPHVFRYGELYGEEGRLPTPPGHVNECLAMARQGRTLEFYGNLNQKRTLTHVDDFAAAVVAVLRHGLTPSRVNIPGEHLMVVDFLMGIAGHYGVDWEPVASRPLVLDENAPCASGDRLLDAALFRSVAVGFKPRHRFRSWLARQSR